ncbi:MAG: TlpA disulfide reductase family protein [Myxococcaceae bacterium]
MAGEDGVSVGEAAPEPPRARRSLIVTLISGLALAGLLAAVILSGIEEARTGAPVARGEPVPAFEMARFSGGTVSHEDLRGKVVMLDFWATWCPPCVKEMPYLVRIAKDYESRGLEFLAASRDDPPEMARADVGIFIVQREPELRRFVTFAGDEVAERFGVQVLPTLYLIDRDGRIIESHRGAISEQQLRARLDEIFANEKRGQVTE